MKTRRQHSAEFKAKVALEAIKAERTVNEIAGDYEVHPVMVQQWKRQALEGMTSTFSSKRDQAAADQEELTAQLYQQIGQLKVELDWLKKKSDQLAADRRACIEPEHPQLSVVRQCQLLDVVRSSYYYKPSGESEYNLLLMHLLDEQYTKTPFYGSPRMTAWLKQQGHAVNHKRVARLLEVMGLQAIYPKPHLSQSTPGHKTYPYLLRDVKILRVDQVWSCDITYIRMPTGFIYLVAVIDWFSRYVLSWSVSISLEIDFCLEALEASLRRGRPEIFNTDQGSQFTSERFTDILVKAGIAVSMDGRGRALDNIFVERLWRTLKYEEVYLKSYASVPEAISSLRAYLRFYNEERLHQSLGYRTPAVIYAAACKSNGKAT